MDSEEKCKSLEFKVKQEGMGGFSTSSQMLHCTIWYYIAAWDVASWLVGLANKKVNIWRSISKPLKPNSQPVFSEIRFAPQIFSFQIKPSHVLTHQCGCLPFKLGFSDICVILTESHAESFK